MWNIKHTGIGRVKRIADPEDTTAGIMKDSIQRWEGRIIRLAGVDGQQEVKLWPTHIDGLNTFPPPFLGIALKTTIRANVFTVSSDNRTSRLYQGDIIVLNFDDQTRMELPFLLGGFVSGKRKVSVVNLSDLQLMRMVETPLDSVEVICNRDGSVITYTYPNEPTGQYVSPRDGRKLIQVVAQRIAGTKVGIAKKWH